VSSLCRIVLCNPARKIRRKSQAFTEKLNNAEVRVLQYHSKPGDKEAMHMHAACVIYIINGGKFKSTTADGKSQVIEYKTGDVVWREALTHSGENVGTTDIRTILVEMKGAKKQ
jgi:quercetin dioxygenase-like cupin family protein